jgi:hypothetical protein
VDKVLDHIVEMGWKKFGYPHKLETFVNTLGLLWVAVDSSVDKETATD